MDKNKYVAYVGTYTHGNSIGIHLYDLDVERGTMKERKVIPINNASHITKANNGKFLYSISDEGVEAFRILPNGDLESINKAGIGGMRGCCVSTDSEDRFLFVAGYHDGKVTVMNLNQDGSIGSIADGIFHKGLGSVAERNFRPHVNWVTITPDQKFLCAVDLGVDHVKLYRLNHLTGKLKLVDILRCELESAPRKLVFRNDGKFAYLICELKNYINVYSYEGSGKTPAFELLQTVSTIDPDMGRGNAASGMKFSSDGKYLFASNAGSNTVSIYEVASNTGMLDKLLTLPISGEYPKEIDVFPDGNHLISLNHESNEITTFRIDYEKKIIVWNSRPLPIDTPNCIVILKVE